MNDLLKILKMNKEQAVYQLTRRFHLASLSLEDLCWDLSLLPFFPKWGPRKALLNSDLERIRTYKDSYPLEHAKKIIINDYEGLELLLQKTREGKKKEWGTLFKVHDDKGIAVVYDILDPSLAKRLGLVEDGETESLLVHFAIADWGGYSGAHHYHPDFRPRCRGAENFNIDLSDRSCSPVNWINLLTFNRLKGPEIIGFNKQHIYIPKDEYRRELVKANSSQIIEYLGK